MRGSKYPRPFRKTLGGPVLENPRAHEVQYIGTCTDTEGGKHRDKAFWVDSVMSPIGGVGLWGISAALIAELSRPDGQSVTRPAAS
jgi:hypothetical protein